MVGEEVPPNLEKLEQKGDIIFKRVRGTIRTRGAAEEWQRLKMRRWDMFWSFPRELKGFRFLLVFPWWALKKLDLDAFSVQSAVAKAETRANLISEEALAV